MRFVAISDTHMSQPELPDGDVLIHAGDLTFTGSLIEISKAALWLHEQKQEKSYKHVIVIAGNHDRLFQKESPLARQIMTSRELIYLEDSGLTLAGSDALLGEISPGPGRITVYGAPWQPAFMNWAFNLPRGEALKAKWDMIPTGIDLLVTHGPPHGIRDGVPTFDEDAYPSDDSMTVRHVGCEELLKAVERIKPKVHVFGHVHSGHGRVERDGTTFINASVMNESYDPQWKPYVFDL
jgi:Icc-related predicted phosphoesterase